MSADQDSVQWSPRVPKRKIRKLYETDALGIHDETLIDEVGWALCARCESFLDVYEAVKGRAKCPKCRSIIVHSKRREELLHCDGCGWEMTWDRYFRSFQHKQLSGAEEVQELFRWFVQSFPAARQPRAKMLLIDQLLHGFHYFAAQQVTTRPVAVNLIEGPMMEVIAFLDSLTYGPASSPGARDTWQKWRQIMSATLKRWGQDHILPP